jgi:hypothetical protein
MKIQYPLGSQTLMKSNAQLRHEGQDEAPQLPLFMFSCLLERPLLRQLLRYAY